jgi:hypothetical protein
VPRKKGDPRLARLRTLIGRAQERCGARAAELAQGHRWLCEVGRRLDPTAVPATEPPPTGTAVRAGVEAVLVEMDTAVTEGRVPPWLQEPVQHVATILRRLGGGLYHCYDVPGLPRTNNALEQFYRRVKTGERRITGRKRSDAFVMRVGGFAAYAITASDLSEAALLSKLATVPAGEWQRERAMLWATQERQTKMRRFRLHRAAYLADLEKRWTKLSEPP